mmetsp:Transcript_58127/g.131720  ORF Transcript_58127/g.131720 Transcript_58127/m.131720 type:complete len:270 (+) Transcript_58127:134-943(+)
MIRLGPRAKAFLPTNSVCIFADVITSAQEARLVEELAPVLSSKPYLRSHWDNVIVGYREVDRPVWQSQENEATVAGIRNIITEFVASEAARSGLLPDDPVCRPLGFTGEWLPAHVVDLAEDGFITPHVDSVVSAGGLVCGLSLLSTAVMVLRPQDPNLATDLEARVEMLLPRRSLYVLSQNARYSFAHSIEPKVDLVFQAPNQAGSDSRETPDEMLAAMAKGAKRERRISLILRDTVDGAPFGEQPHEALMRELKKEAARTHRAGNKVK